MEQKEPAEEKVSKSTFFAFMLCLISNAYLLHIIRIFACCTEALKIHWNAAQCIVVQYLTDINFAYYLHVFTATQYNSPSKPIHLHLPNNNYINLFLFCARD